MRIIYTLILFLIGTDLFSQKKFTTEELSNMVVCIADQFGSELNLLGTATIISDSTNYYLVSATHVTDAIKGDCFLIFKKDNDIPVSVPLKLFLNKEFKNWENHKEADVSIIKLVPFDSNSKSRLMMWSFPLSQVMDTLAAIDRNMNVIVMGFPTIKKIGEHFSPFTFNSFFSSGLITLPRGDTKISATFQVLENPSVQGYSGGPVFIGFSRPGITFGPELTILVGVIHGTSYDNTGGKQAMITPAVYIQELVTKAK